MQQASTKEIELLFSNPKFRYYGRRQKGGIQRVYDEYWVISAIEFARTFVSNADLLRITRLDQKGIRL
jgi:hypothetical protein